MDLSALASGAYCTYCKKLPPTEGYKSCDICRWRARLHERRKRERKRGDFVYPPEIGTIDSEAATPTAINSESESVASSSRLPELPTNNLSCCYCGKAAPTFGLRSCVSCRERTRHHDQRKRQRRKDRKANGASPIPNNSIQSKLCPRSQLFVIH